MSRSSGKFLRIIIDIPLPLNGSVLSEEERSKLDRVSDLLLAIFSSEISDPELEAKQNELLEIVYDVFRRDRLPKLKVPLQKMLQPAIADSRLDCLRIIRGIAQMA